MGKEYKKLFLKTKKMKMLMDEYATKNEIFNQ
jgi:hypothetical protein